MRAGRLKYRIVIQRYTATTDDFGGEVPAWADYASAYADVVFSAGTERRSAAQEGAAAPATFTVRRNEKTTAMTVRDRIRFDAGDWDIINIVPSRRFKEGYDIEAVRVAA